MSVAVSPAWAPVLTSECSTLALGVASELVARLADPAQLARAVALSASQTRYPGIVGWRPHSLAHGDAGLALLWEYLDAVLPGRGWDMRARAHIEAAARDASTLPPLAAGLWSGLGGVAFAAAYASRHGARYRRFLDAVDDTLVPQVGVSAAAVHGAGPGAVQAFDVISGLAGSGAYLLHRRDDPRCEEALRASLSALVALVLTDDDDRPRWWTPPEFLHPDSRALHPFGNLNCGLAHGIPGPLALLSLSALHGITVDGSAVAIVRIADWLCAHRVDDEWGVNWPYAVGVPPRDGATMPGGIAPAVDAPPAAGAATSRAGWCYGSPGVARALWLAGAAAGEPRYRDTAVAAMDAVLRRPAHVREVASAPFCHGLTGLLQIVLRFAQETGLPQFAREADALAREIVELYEPDRPLGYCSHEGGGTLVDNPGLLDGATGVALVLLAACSDVEPAWDRAFLLS